MQLNNYLQANGGARLLTWEVYQSGPLHQPSWTAIAYSPSFNVIFKHCFSTNTCLFIVRGVEYGRAFGSSQASVKEEAARQTLSALYHDRRGYA